MQYYLKMADEYGKKEGAAVEAIHNIEFNRLSEDKKKELKEFSDGLKG